MVVQRRDGPRRLREHDDDDDFLGCSEGGGQMSGAGSRQVRADGADEKCPVACWFVARELCPDSTAHHVDDGDCAVQQKTNSFIFISQKHVKRSPLLSSVPAARRRSRIKYRSVVVGAAIKRSISLAAADR